jgi:hypothetical protein
MHANTHTNEQRKKRIEEREICATENDITNCMEILQFIL